jgi:hypothetical protein
MNTGDTQRHTTKSPLIIHSGSAYWISKPLTGRESGPAQIGVVSQTKKPNLSQLGLECTTLNPIEKHSISWRDKQQQDHKSELAGIVAALKKRIHPYCNRQRWGTMANKK